MRMIRKTKGSSIRFLIFFWVFASCVLLLGFYTYVSGELNRGYLEDQGRSNLDQLTQTHLALAERYFSELEQMAEMICLDSDVQEAVHYRNVFSHDLDYRIELYNMRRVAARLAQLNLLQTVDAALIIGANQEYLYYHGRSPLAAYPFKEAEWFSQAIAGQNGRPSFTGLHEQDYLFGKQGSPVTSLVMPIYDIKSLSRAPEAWLLLDFRPSDAFFLNSIFPVQNENSAAGADSEDFFAIVKNDEILYMPPSVLSTEQVEWFKTFVLSAIAKESVTALVPAEDQGESAHFLLGKNSPNTGWMLYGFKSLSAIEHLKKEQLRSSLLLALLLLPLVFLFSWLISGRLSFPLRRLESEFNLIAAGDLDLHFSGSSIREVASLSEAAYRMVHNIVRLKDEIAEANLHALQQQINPHFLNNVLQTIKALAITEDYAGISRLNTELGKFLSYAVYSPYAIVQLSEECAYCQTYLNIQAIRFPDRFHYDFYIEKELLTFPCPKVLLQPLVENAILHAMRAAAANADAPQPMLTIVVRARTDAERVRIEVCDDGLGIEREKLEKLHEALQEDSLAERAEEKIPRGIALRNVRRRMIAFYGEGAELRVTSVAGSGTSVSLEIPKNMPAVSKAENRIEDERKRHV